MAEKEVKVKVATDVEMEKVQALEDKVKELKIQRIRMQVEADTAQLETVNQKLEEAEEKLSWLQSAKANPEITVNDETLEEAEAEVQALKEQQIALELSVETGSLEAAKAEVEELDGKEIHVNLDASMQNVAQGFTQAKQGAIDLKNAFVEVQQAGLQSEQNLGFLALNLPGGLAEARVQMQAINDIVASMPGDDNTMRSVLSTAQALGNNLKPEEMKAAVSTMADYMQGSATMGKQAVESQQDIMKYLLDGNTAELERGSIVSSQVDKLKEATTFQERQAAMQQVLNELGYGGIANLDTTINKQAEWEGMLYNSQDALSSMWLPFEKGAMDFILKLNDMSGGLVGMGIVLSGMVGGPLIDLVTGVGQIGVGLRGLKDGIGILKELSSVKKIYSAITQALIPVEYAEGAAGWFSIGWMLVAVAAGIALGLAFIYLYENVDWFREGVDYLIASLSDLVSYLSSEVMTVIDSLSQQFQAFTEQLGLNTEDWTQAVLGFILFIPQLPARLATELANALAKALGFKTNFVTYLTNAGKEAYNNFIGWISSIYTKFKEEVDKIIGEAQRVANEVPWYMKIGGVGAVVGWIGSTGEKSPGYMYDAFSGELTAMQDIADKHSKTLPATISGMGSNMLNNFDVMNTSINTDSNGVNGQTINLSVNVGTVDNDDRVRQIVDAVRRELAWNNATAGRTI